jgi:hypothetical protein
MQVHVGLHKPSIMKWSMDHVLTWCFMTEFVLTVDLYRLINTELLSLHGGTIRQQAQNCRLYG